MMNSGFVHRKDHSVVRSNYVRFRGILGKSNYSGLVRLFPETNYSRAGRLHPLEFFVLSERIMN